MRLLLIEDDDGIAEVVRAGLEEARFIVDRTDNGETGLRMARKGGYALIILDVMLPRLDGLAVCRALRAERVVTPILMVTARDAVPDRVRGFELGADDYLPKPFDFSELLARVRALVRRDRIHKGRVIRIADLEIDTDLRVVTRGGDPIHLTPREYRLLEALAANEGRVLTREVIQERIWMDEEAASNTVDVHINFLRKKIDAGHDQRLIHTVHRVGYVLRAPRLEVG